MALVKDGVLAEDPWLTAETEAALETEAPLFVTLELWQGARERLAGRNAPLGLRLRSDQSAEELAGELEHFDAVALEFPKFTDGRAFSTARILRERLGFEGELRAVGAVKRDQLAFLQRCGFDAVEVPDGVDAEAWLESLREFSHWYQPAADGYSAIAALRHRPQAAE